MHGGALNISPVFYGRPRVVLPEGVGRAALSDREAAGG